MNAIVSALEQRFPGKAAPNEGRGIGQIECFIG
jgi:hypothetical protein